MRWGEQQPQEASVSCLTPLCGYTRSPSQLAGPAWETQALCWTQPFCEVSGASVGIKVVPELQLHPASLRCPHTPFSTPREAAVPAAPHQQMDRL